MQCQGTLDPKLGSVGPVGVKDWNCDKGRTILL